MEEEIIVCHSSPTPSEKRYSFHFSQETITLSDGSVNNDVLDALDQHHREIYNEEYGIAVDNFLLNRVGRNPQFKRELNPVTNPYCFKVAGIEIHGTSGQNIDSLRNLTTTKSTIELMNGIIEIGTILPTAPDSLDLFPYNNLKGKDPFAFEQLPHIFFAGNQNEFATELMDYGNNQKVRFISIPKFEESYSMIAVNLKDLKTSQIKSRKRPPHLYQYCM
uniref:DNA polymerase alpha/delta/epsilon subunit B domain-containing protein n=1 Tax=Panagrolaimus davidi TaxID=227884 RepID=A0A914QCJ4_9BILA